VRFSKLICDRHRDRFSAFDKTQPDRTAKILVPIEIKPIADTLKVDTDIVFGRLHYHLAKKHGYRDADGDGVVFFALEFAGDTYVVNFPLMAAVLGGLQDEHGKYVWALVVSILASESRRSR
jgi:hypothetical protein